MIIEQTMLNLVVNNGKFFVARDRNIGSRGIHEKTFSEK